MHGGQAGLKAGSLPRLAAKTGGPTQREQNFGAAVNILSKPVNITLPLPQYRPAATGSPSGVDALLQRKENEW